MDLHISSINHIALLCTSVKRSVDFYENILGFGSIKRPDSLDFDGAWLFNYGIGIHLIKCENEKDIVIKSEINPRDHHISFQCTDLKRVEEDLQQLEIRYLKQSVTNGEVVVEQIFFHDPDGLMIEVCNCNNIPVIPLSNKQKNTVI